MCDSGYCKPRGIHASADRVTDQRVSIAALRGRIVIEASDRVNHELDVLVDGITSGNTHEEADFGAPVGKEIW